MTLNLHWYFLDTIQTGSRGHTRFASPQSQAVAQMGNDISNSEFFGVITSKRSPTPFADAAMQREKAMKKDLEETDLEQSPPPKPKLRLYDPINEVYYDL